MLIKIKSKDECRSIAKNLLINRYNKSATEIEGYGIYFLLMIAGCNSSPSMHENEYTVVSTTQNDNRTFYKIVHNNKECMIAEEFVEVLQGATAELHNLLDTYYTKFKREITEDVLSTVLNLLYFQEYNKECVYKNMSTNELVEAQHKVLKEIEEHFNYNFMLEFFNEF